MCVNSARTVLGGVARREAPPTRPAYRLTPAENEKTRVVRAYLLRTWKVYASFFGEADRSKPGRAAGCGELTSGQGGPVSQIPGLPGQISR